MILVKNLNFLTNFFLSQKGLDMIFDDVLDKKISLVSRLQKCHIKLPFLRGKPMILIKKLKFLFNLFLFQKASM